MNQNDLDLIRNAKHGRTEAFATLINNYKNFVFRTAYGVLQNQHDAEDVTQETFIKVHRSLKNLHDEGTFPTWLARITVRTAIDWLRQSQRYQSSLLDMAPATTGDVSHSDMRLDLEQALSLLTTNQRTIIILREVRGFDYEELAKILDIPIGTVRSRLHNARNHLRQLLLTNEGRK